ncbi:MAG: tetratricopeptide repeat protein [Rhodocyclales bacterium]|nr:tetratricopeptide repeat protein [Rhodocyclales bacterium]
MDKDVASDSLCSQAERLCDLGLYLQVQPMLESLERHPSIPARMMAIRVLGHLGARRLAESRILRLWRANPGDAWAAVGYLRAQCYRRGPHRAWRQFDVFPAGGEVSAECLAEFQSLRAYTLGSLRDFREARAAHAEARRLDPKAAWPLVEWAHVCEMADGYDEGLAAADEALDMSPGYRPAIQVKAHLLSLVAKEDAALDLLRRSARTSESGALHAQLLDLEIEKGHFREAWETLDRCVDLHPLGDKTITTWLEAQRTDLALRLDRPDEAMRHAGAVGTDFYRRIGERLAAGETSGRRVLLPVGFVRQHYRTCAPATLAALSAYWSHPADHMEIAEQICYDGTPNHSERSWAEDQGFIVREFTVDWATARALIDAGIPFTLTTTWPGGAHLQAVIGYDELRGTLLIRDPFKRLHGEFEARPLFESHRSTGPRGMVLLPVADAGRIAGIELPEAALWEGYHGVMTALKSHAREAALARAQEIEARNPGHRLTLAARRALAMYDGDEAGILAATEGLLAQFPDDINLQLSKAASLSLLGAREHRIAWLAGIAERAGAEPLSIVSYAQLLGQDGRESPRAVALLQRVLDRIPTEASAWYARANVLWDQGAKDRSIAHYRIAACISDTDENYAVAYFRAAHFVRQTEPGLEFLRQRMDRLGRKSPYPLMTLFNQLEMLERTEQAFRLLDQGLAEHPDDPDLLLFATEANLRFLRIQEASRLLARAEERAKRAPWLRLRAYLARENGDLAGALELAREASALEPLNLQHYRLVALLTARTEGRSKTIAYLREATTRFDHHFGLHQLLIEWLNEEGLAAVEPVLRHLIAINSGSAWARRELAINLARQHRYDEALALMATVGEMAAGDSYTHSTLGFVRLHQGHTAEGRRHLRDALVLSIDNDYALSALVESGATLSERQKDLEFVRGELVRQVTLGDSLLNFQSAAQRTLAPDEVLAVMREAHTERPDLWQSWTGVGLQLIEMGRMDEALEFIESAIDRFPMLPRLRLEQGRIFALQGRRDSARESYKMVLQISPQWTRAVRLYVDTVVDEGVDFHRALAVLDSALARNPEDADLRGVKSWILWRNAERAAAVAELPQALALDPRPNWMWNTLQLFGDETGDPDLPRRTATGLVDKRPGDVWSWIRMAEYAADLTQAIDAIDRALALEPRSQAAFETRLALLMKAGRFDDVEAALAGHPWEGLAPIAIRVFSARVARSRGDAKEATRRLRAMIDEDPNNFMLWELQANWSDEDDRPKAYLDAAENLVRLAPNFHKSHGFLADALLKVDDPDRAVRHLERALQLDPTYSFAGFKLTDFYLDRGQVEKAEATLATLTLHTRNVFVAAREIRLAGLRGDQEAAAGRLPEVLRGSEEWPVTTALDVFVKAGWEKRLEEVVEACFTTGSCANAAIHFWIERQDRGFIPGSYFRNIKRGLANDSKHTLMRGLLDYAGAKSNVRLLNHLLRAYRDILTADPGCWAMVSYALVTTNQHKRTASWMSDWRSRPETPTWALDNLAVSLRTIGDHKTARAVSLRSLELSPNNLDAKTWMAVDAAREDRLAELATLLAEINPDHVRTYYKNLLALLRAYHLGAHSRDSTKTLLGFGQLTNVFKQSAVLRDLARLLGRRMVTRYTPLLLRPIRWLQFALV